MPVQFYKNVEIEKEELPESLCDNCTERSEDIKTLYADGKVRKIICKCYNYTACENLYYRMKSKEESK